MRSRPSRVAHRPAGVVAASALDPTVALVASPVTTPRVEVVTAGAPRHLPALPGSGHPAFPVLLAAVLLGVVALGCRGDRRDPKLAAAAIDDRDDRTRFR